MCQKPARKQGFARDGVYRLQRNRSPPVFLNQECLRVWPSLTVGLLTHPLNCWATIIPPFCGLINLILCQAIAGGALLNSGEVFLLDQTFAFSNRHNFICADTGHGIDNAAGPANFYEVDCGSLLEAEM